MTDDSLKKVALIAQLAGYSGHTDSEKGEYIVDVPLTDDRDRRVRIQPFTDEDGEACVSFYSSCSRVKSRRFSKADAIALLIENGANQFARYGLREDDGYMEIVVIIDHLLDTLDPKEFSENTIWVVLQAERYQED